MEELKKEDILKILPHGETVIDLITELKPGEKATGEIIFGYNAFPGHFSKIQFAPLSILLEAAFQVGQVAICSDPKVVPKIKAGFLPIGIGIDEIKKIKRKVFVGQKIKVKAWIDKSYSGFFHPGHVSWIILSGDKEILKGGFHYILQDVNQILKEKETR